MSKEIREFFKKQFSAEVMEKVDNIRLIEVDFGPSMPMVFMPVNAEGKFDPMGEPAIGINPKCEIFHLEGIDQAFVDAMFVHEYAHYEQFSTGRLKFQNGCTQEAPVIEWEGVIHFPTTVISEYVKQPWEIEAFEAQGRHIDTANGWVPGTWVNGYIDQLLNM